MRLLQLRSTHAVQTLCIGFPLNVNSRIESRENYEKLEMNSTFPSRLVEAPLVENDQWLTGKRKEKEKYPPVSLNRMEDNSTYAN